MKRNLYLILSLLVIPFLTYSQSKDYFKNKILELDPIEGIYDADIFKQGANAFQTFPETYETSTKLTIARVGENKFSISGGRPNDYIERVGETNVYNYWNHWDAAGWVRTRFYLLNSGRSFEWRFEVPDTQLKSDLGRNYQYGIRVMIRYNCVKEYPTTSMYLEAEEEAIRIEQERQRQQEIEAAKKTEWSGSGFALNNGYFVTNYHVVEDANIITVKGVKGDFNTAFDAEIVATDKYNDLALLKINDSRFTGFGSIPYKLKTNTSDVGEEIFVLGYPLTSTMGDEIKLTTGVISSKTGFQGDVSLYQISAPVQPGNSGGPLFDSKGNLIGIVSSKHMGAENVGYAIKTSYLMNLVESAVSSSIIPVNNTITSQPLTGKVKSVKNYVFMISCSNSIGQDKQIINEGKPVSNVTESTETKNDVNNLIRYFSNVIIDTKMFTWKLISIEVNDSNTILTQTCIPKINDAYIYCDKSEYIEDAETGDKYYLVSSSIAMSPEMTFIGDSERTFSESYPKLPSTVKVINIWAGNSYYVKNYRIR